MKKYSVFIFTLIMLLGFSVFAQDASPVIEQPPQWLVNALEFLNKAPIVGPYMVKIAQWFGVVVTIVTALTAFVLTSLNALKGVLNLSGLVNAALAVEAFKSGKIMYWLKYVSALFNASKKNETALVDKPVEKVS